VWKWWLHFGPLFGAMVITFVSIFIHSLLNSFKFIIALQFCEYFGIRYRKISGSYFLVVVNKLYAKFIECNSY